MVRLSKNIIRQALDLSPVATVIADLKSDPPAIQYVNQAFEALSGYDAAEVIGRPWESLCQESNEREASLRCHARLGAAAEIRLDLFPLYEGPGAPQYWLGTEQQHESDDSDTEREALLSVLRDARTHLRRLDGRDSATGVLSRRAFDDLLQRDWVLARREDRNVAVMLFRLDDFGAYGEVYGRHAADACLRKIAHAITGSLRREGDMTARYADDCFAVLMGDASEAQAADMAGRIAAKVRGLAIHHPRSMRDRFVTLSWGVASARPEGLASRPDLIAKATEAMGNPGGALDSTAGNIA